MFCMKKLLSISLLLLFIGQGLSAQDNEPYRTRSFGFDWRTIQVQVEDNQLAPPIITLGEANRIVISFDHLAEDVTYLQYSIIHCDADWRPSQLSELEYMDGMNTNNIEDYAFSTNTFAHYVNYRITLPNDDVQLTKSGNYVVLVYPEFEPENVVVQACFSISEQSVNVAASASSRTDIGYNTEYQQVDVTVSHPYYQIGDPFNDLKVQVSQNSRYDNEVLVTKPLRAMNDVIYYEHNRDLIFQAGNEYRRFEMVSIRYAGMGIADLQYFEPYYHAFLATDYPRYGSSYFFDRTQYGRYVIRESNASDSDLEADYFVVHFTLDEDRLRGGNVYIGGALTGHLFDENSLMQYNEETQQYERVLFLKQGAYNYMYLFLPDGSNTATTAPTEGNYYETINEYLVKVYHRPPGSRYDRLIGTAICYSGR